MQQFWKNYEYVESGCREWRGSARKSGYGLFRGMPAHIFSYILAHPDEDIEGLVIHHICRNRLCGLQEHLQALTRSDHKSLHWVEDGPPAEYERKSHCGRGHEFNEKNTGWQTDGDGYRNRYCLECKRENSIEFNKTQYVAHPKPTPTHCPQGHEYTAENAKYYVRPDGKTKLSCRECNRLRANVNRNYQGMDPDVKAERAETRRLEAVEWRESQTHCKRGHEWNDKSKYVAPNGTWTCRTCKNDAKHEKRRTQSLTSLTKEQSKPSSGS